MNRQYGGTLTKDFEEINQKIQEIEKPIDIMIISIEKQIEELNLLSSNIVKGLTEAQIKLSEIPLNTEVNMEEVQRQLENISRQIM